MPGEIETYFETIATIATNALAASSESNPKPTVSDAPQEARATAWSALAVHPMSVLETAYVSIVQQAEAEAGNDQALAREKSFEALSDFFSLAADVPPLLTPDSEALIEDQLKDLLVAFEQVEVTPDFVELTAVVQLAANIVAMITTAPEKQYAMQDIQDAADYLDLFNTPPGGAGAKWAADHPVDQQNTLGDRIDDVRTSLIQKLRGPGTAAASPRSLYNIAPFYLFRLMHRFVGGDQKAPMSLKDKGIASGAATKVMNRAGWAWLSTWHEKQIIRLKTLLATLNGTLSVKFTPQGEAAVEVIRFHLKGGRAMYTALGQPQNGGNDWDTGIMINPTLTPENWYIAFRSVNDLVVTYLDQARFSYTALLNQNSADLPDIDDQLNVVNALEDREMGDPDEQSDYTRHGLRAEFLQENRQIRSSGGGVPTTAENMGLEATALFQQRGLRVRPSGVNGELIDIGISTRSSVELMEHWLTIDIQDCQGITEAGIPVPKLPYFVDDFSTIIREAIVQETVDRKLAKRLRRLLLVLNSQGLAQASGERVQAVTQSLPKAAAALVVGADLPEARLTAWCLAAIIGSVANFYLRAEWLAAFDDYIVAAAGALFDPATVAQMWPEIEAAIPDENNDRADCKKLFIVQTAMSALSGTVIKDYAFKAASIGSPSQLGAAHWATAKKVIDATLTFYPPGGGQGSYYLTGGLAATLQTNHAEVALNDDVSLSGGGAIEIFYRQGTVSPDNALAALVGPLGVLVGGPQYDVARENIGGVDALVVRSKVPINRILIAPAKPAILVIRAEGGGVEKARILDHIDGWAVASTRDLTRLFANRAAHSDDYDLRKVGKAAASFLKSDVLSRQLR